MNTEQAATVSGDDAMKALQAIENFSVGQGATVKKQNKNIEKTSYNKNSD